MRQFFTFLLATMLWPVISFSQNNPEFKTYQQGSFGAEAFTTNNFKCIGVGKGNVIWAGTQYGGLYMYSDSFDIWRKSDQLTNVFINDIKADADSGIWIAQSGIRTMGGNTTNIAGGVNYFRVASDLSNEFYSVEGTTTGANIVSRNVKSLYLDQSYKEATGSLPRPWVASGTYITSGKTKKGGINIGLNKFMPYFNEVKDSLDNSRDATPMCEAIGGDGKEVWVAVRQNFGKSQILRYNPSGKFIGAYTGGNPKDSLLPAGFTAQAIFMDKRGNRWIGLKSGGLVIQTPKGWMKMDWESVIPPGTAINYNAIASDEFGNIYIGTSNGLLEFESQEYNPLASPDNPNSYKRYTDLNGLPSNNITGIAYDKKNGKVLITSSGGVTFMNKKEPHIRGVVFDVYCAIDSANPYTGLQKRPWNTGVTVKLFYNGEEKESVYPLSSGVFELVEAEDDKAYTVEVSYKENDSTIKFVYNNVRNHTLMMPTLIPDSLMGELKKFKSKMRDREFPVALTFGVPLKLTVKDCFTVDDYELALEPFYRPSGITKDHEKVVDNLGDYYAALATVYDLGGKMTDLNIDAITNGYDAILALKDFVKFSAGVQAKAKEPEKIWEDPHVTAKIDMEAQASILMGTLKTMKTSLEIGLKKISSGLSAYPKVKEKMDRYITAWSDATDLAMGIGEKMMSGDNVSGALTDAFWGNIKKVLIQEVAMQYYKQYYAQEQHKDFVFKTSNYSKYATSKSTYTQTFDQLYNPNSNSLVKYGKDTLDNSKSSIETLGYIAKYAENAAAIADAVSLLAVVPGGQIIAAGAKVVSYAGKVIKPAALAGAMYLGAKGSSEIADLSDQIIEKSGFVSRKQPSGISRREGDPPSQKSPDALIASKNNYNQKLTNLQIVYNTPVYDPINYGNKYREFIVADSQYTSEMNKTISALSASTGNAIISIPGFSSRLDKVIDSFVTQQYSRRYALYFQNIAFLYDSAKIDDVPELNSLANEIKILNDSAINGIVSLIGQINDNNIPAPAYLAQDSYVMDHDNVPGTEGSVTYTFTNYGTEPQNNVSFKIGEPTEGFTLTSANLIKFGTIQPGETKEVSFTFMSPVSTDSFTIGKYRINISADNGEFNDVSGAMYIFKPASTTPVKLSKFNASCVNTGAKITWQTASEENSSHFEIEKSADGFTWASLASLEAAGNSNLKRDYEFTDLNAGAAFYRLKQIDKDGQFTYSDIRRVGCKVQSAGLSVYPIPATNVLNVAINISENSTAKVLLVDIAGRVIQHFDTNLKNGMNHLQLNVEGLAAGQYLLRVNGLKISKTQKITIGR